MAIPTYEDFMRPTLEILAALGPLPSRELRDRVAQHFDLTEAERAETIPSGTTVLASRVGWACTYLAQAGLIHRPRRGVSEITDTGRQFLATHTGAINRTHLLQFPEFVAFLNRSRESQAPRDLTTSAPRATQRPSDPLPTHLSPEEAIEEARKAAHDALRSELLRRLHDLEPIAFENLVLKLLGAMGYGAQGKIEPTAHSGDAGIDGVISQDPLGLDRIYVQAKRYGADNSVGRPAMQSFVGALHGQQADRGVFMTTSTFTREALEYATHVGARIIPITGHEMADLMIRHRVGVQPRLTAVLLGMDEDFFEQL